MKQKILLNWPYHRRDWIIPFINLQDQFEFIFLAYPVRPNSFYLKDFKTIYWKDYTCAQEILDDIDPAKVIFMSIESAYSIALNTVAQRRSIPTAILQHGLFHDYKFYRAQEKANRKKYLATPKIEILYPSDKRHILRFLFKSQSFLDSLKIPSVLFFLLFKDYLGINFALKLFPFSWRIADKYICYTMFNARIFIERDKIKRRDIFEVGNPSNDQFFDESNFNQDSQDYYLLIDQPFAENSFNSFNISKEEMNLFYDKLNKYCLQKGSKLYIKLHPESYNSSFMIQDENITYIKNKPVLPLIMGSRGCFGTFSTILIPALFFKKCVLFRTIPSQTQNDIINLGMAQLLDFKSFNIEDIDFTKVKIKADQELFIKRYFYKIDGNSTSRLSEVLENKL